MKSEGIPCKGVRSQMDQRMQTASLSPEICIVVAIKISSIGSCGVKAGELREWEGSRPGCDMVSRQAKPGKGG